jgi:DNA topoisomerase-1
VSERPVVAKEGRFGVYVTDGTTNASLGKGDRVEEMTPERAFELLAIRREQAGDRGGPRTSAGPRKAASKKAASKKAPSKKAGARKAPAKKSPPPS